VPGALIGAPMREMLSGAADMAEGCRQENHRTPGSSSARSSAPRRRGRDKLTVVLPPSLQRSACGSSSSSPRAPGKHGKGALPVVDEPLGTPDEYGAIARSSRSPRIATRRRARV
jgi:hypothetical protein